jgi:TonB family protein
MKAAPFLLSLCLLALPSVAQTPHQRQIDRAVAQAFAKQAHADGIEHFISTAAAESLVVHRVEPVLPRGDYIARVTGTVVIAFEITRNGSVRHTTPVSGPKLLQAPALKALRQWQFRPYLRNGRPTTVATSISLTLSNF